jgi:5-methylcytosine-specific restriction endonuclease McrA
VPCEHGNQNLNKNGVCRLCSRKEAWQKYNRERKERRAVSSKMYTQRLMVEEPDGLLAKRADDSRNWRKRHPDKHNQNNSTYRARKFNAPGFHTLEEWEALLAAYDWRCEWCNHSGTQPLHKDHVVPFTKGGGNDIYNLQPLCGPCNSSKKNRENEISKNKRRKFLGIQELAN